ncbi:helix-turn-helix domain-containing protein [Streptomyces albicerus]|uniref:helix-turn-helix domain-containing protein n=1 Tax=Streptomyces albicerus TaxID=2569859 RepID=UPI001CEDD241|nr:helix-turn-helix domain-containing protein [Streptomyces albicerus]
MTCDNDLGQLGISVLRSADGPRSVLPWLSEPGVDDDALYVALQLHGSTAVLHGGNEVFLEPGDIVFCDPGRPGSPRFGEHSRMTVFRIPRRCLGIADSDLRRIMGVPLGCGEGVRALVSHFLSVLASEAEFRRTRVGDRLARNAVDLLAVLVTEFVGEEAAHSTDAGGQTLSRIRTFVELHLTDPDLSPESIALAHHISVRYLHKLFQSEGTTVSQWVRSRRLDACRRELGRAPRRRLTVAAVAHRWGFTSASHFSRAFRDAYGMSPSEWQALAPSDAAAPVPAGPPGVRRSPDGVRPAVLLG